MKKQDDPHSEVPAELGWAWGRIRAQVLADNERDNDGVCQAQLYGCLGRATEVHHIVARVNHGGHIKGNLAAICGACHYRYTTETVRERAAERRQQKRQQQRRNRPGRKDRYTEDDYPQS